MLYLLQKSNNCPPDLRIKEWVELSMEVTNYSDDRSDEIEVTCVNRKEMQRLVDKWSKELGFDTDNPPIFIAGERSGGVSEKKATKVEDESLYDGSSKAAVDTQQALMPLTKEEKFLQRMEEVMDKDLFKLIYNPEAADDFDKVLADFTTTEAWDNILNLHKEGKLTTDDVRDMLMTSHLRVGQQRDASTQVDPREIVKREVKEQLKGRLGHKILGAFVDTASSVGMLAAPKEQVRLMLSSGKVETEEQAEQKATEEMTGEVKSKAADALDKALKEDIVFDVVKNIQFAILKDKLKDENDVDFDVLRRAIVDLGFERLDRKIQGQKFVIYVINLDSLYETDGVGVDQRSVVKWVIEDVKTVDQAEQIIKLVNKRIQKNFEDRLEMIKIREQRGELEI